MKKAGIVLMEGYEESEAVVIADLLKRCGISCSFYSPDILVTGAHGITIQADHRMKDLEEHDPDLLILPGGYEAVDRMKEEERLLEILRQRSREGKMIGALCAAPAVLDAAGILTGRNCTVYPGVEVHSGNLPDELVVRDGCILTGKGPAIAYPFALALAEALGADVRETEHRLLYDELLDRGQNPEKEDAA